jgi:hypothetical protein
MKPQSCRIIVSSLIGVLFLTVVYAETAEEYFSRTGKALIISEGNFLQVTPVTADNPVKTSNTEDAGIKNADGSAGGLENFYSAEHGLKLTAPQGWEVFSHKDPERMRKAIGFVRQEIICVIKQSIDSKPAVFLSYQDRGQELSIDRLSEESRNFTLALNQQSPQTFQIIESENIITVNGIKFSKSITRIQDERGDTTSINYYFIKGAILYNLICSADSFEFDSYKDLFERIAASIEFR